VIILIAFYVNLQCQMRIINEEGDVQQKKRTHANIDVSQGVIDIQKGMFSKRS
jgi:hypothetical protein